jgi:predicted AlkP superfamily phosphohydrolase/phosphomutase
LISDVIDRYGADPLNGNSDAYGPDPEDYLKLVHQLLDRMEMKTRMSCDYLERGGWDLFLTVFAEAHDIGHMAWHLHDTAHVRHDPEWVRRHGDPVKAVYVGLDNAVGRLLDKSGPSTTVIVLAGLGMEPDYTANHFMDDILRRLDFGPDADAPQSIEGLSTGLRKLVPPGVRQFLKKTLSQKGFVLLASDRYRRRFFAVPHDENSGAVRINVFGREPCGVIEPGEEYEACCEMLTKNLLDIVNLHTGEPIITQVVKVANVCDGPHVVDLPDLFAVWHRTKPISAVASPRIGEIRKPYPGTRTGDHTANGMFLAQGPTVARGEIRTPVRVTALAPTIAALLDAELPQAEEAPLAQFRTLRDGG